MEKNKTLKLEDQHSQPGQNGVESPIHVQSETNVQFAHLQREIKALLATSSKLIFLQSEEGYASGKVSTGIEIGPIHIMSIIISHEPFEL